MVAVGGLAMQTIIATSAQVGLAVELQKAKPADSRTVDVLKQAGAGATICGKLLEDYRQRTKFADPSEAALMAEFIDMLRSIAIQSEAYEKSLTDPDPKHKQSYLTHRKKVGDFIMQRAN